jgi:hypothetical protein
VPWSRLECPGAAWSALPPAAAAVATTATAAVWVSGVSGGGAGVPGGALELRKLRVVGLEVAPWPGPRECVVCRKPRDELSPPQVSSPKKRQNNRFVWFRGGGRRRSREAVGAKFPGGCAPRVCGVKFFPGLGSAPIVGGAKFPAEVKHQGSAV